MSRDLDMHSFSRYTKTTVGNYFKCVLLLDMQLKKGRVQMCVATRYATKKRSSSNVLNSILLNGVLFLRRKRNGYRTLLLY